MARKPGPTLDRVAVLQAAASLADESGLDRLTLGALASHLKVQPPSLYNHIAGLSGLHRDLAISGVRELTRRMERAAVGKSGDDALLALAHAYRAYARERPGLYAASVRAPAPGDEEWLAAADDAVQVVLAVLVGYRLEGEDALHATRGLRSLLHGFVALEAGDGFGLPLNLDGSFERLLRSFLLGLRSGVYGP